jgi:CDP-diacylglycerol--glycerol-3-phosphate 3-phosphatidyltransferase
MSNYPNLPNLLTIVRILLIPLFCIFIFDLKNTGIYKSSHPENLTIAGIIFSIAAITDYFDGYFARKWNQITTAGKLLDPLADKILTTAAFIGFIEWGFVPGWTVVVILTREFLITGLRSIIVESGGKSSGASILGKIKTFLQMSSIILILFEWEILGVYVYYLSLFFTVYSGIDYLYKARKYLKFN